MKRKYIKRTELSAHAKKRLPNKHQIAALVSISLIIISRFTAIPFMEKQMNYVSETFEYNGVIDFWDISALTVRGNKYSVIKTICSEYAQKYNSFRINFTSLSERSAAESLMLNINRGNVPDVVRSKIGSYEANQSSAISDTALSEYIASLYEPYIQRSNPYSDKLIIDMYCDISLILINRDVVSELNVSYDKNRLTNRDDFIAFLEKLSANNITRKYNIIDFSAEDIYAYLPFTINEKGYYDSSYLSSVSAYLPQKHSERTKEEAQNDFLSGQTAVYCADLDTLNILIRRNLQGRGFDFDYCLYPYENEKIIFVNDITSYIFNESDDPDKNTVLKDFALYMLSDDALQYTQNLGKINCTSTFFDYEDFPHMKDFKDKNAVYFTYRDPEMKVIYAKLSSFYGKGD